MIKKITCLSIFFVLFAISNAFAGHKLETIKHRGKVICGTNFTTKAYAYQDKDKLWQGIDAEMCRVLSLAIFDNPDKIALMHVPSNKVFKYVEDGKIDIMLGSVSYTASNNIFNNIDFPAITYYSHQGFIARYIEGASSMQAYSKKNVCVATNTSYYTNLKKYNYNYKLEFNIIPLKNIQKAKEYFLLKRCDLLTGDIIALKAKLLNENLGDDNIVVLPESVTRKPVSPIVVNNDKQFKELVKWAIYSLILAEEKGINSKNVESFQNSNDEEVKNMLGINKEMWIKLGLNPKWFQKALSVIGNYGEMYERTLGNKSYLKIERGINKLWKNGGKIQAPSMI